MFRHINKFGIRLLYSAAVILINGCLLNSVTGSGYVVDIKVTQTKVVELEDIKFLDNIAVSEHFTLQKTSSLDNRECQYFNRYLNEEKYKHLHYKFIILGYCYDNISSIREVKGINNLRILIYNDWSGQDFALKQEIDKIAEIFYKELSKRFAKENIRIEKRRTGPPF